MHSGSTSSEEFPEASTRAQREIVRLRLIVLNMSLRSGIDPEDPSLVVPPPGTETPSLPLRVSQQSTSASRTSLDSDRTDSIELDRSETASDALPALESPRANSPASSAGVRSEPVEVFREPSFPARVKAQEEDKKILPHTTKAAPHISIATDAEALENWRSGVFGGSKQRAEMPYESPHSVTPTSWTLSSSNQQPGWYEQNPEARRLWPGASLISPMYEMAQDWTTAR
jgi:hypothetical protein